MSLSSLYTCKLLLIITCGGIAVLARIVWTLELGYYCLVLTSAAAAASFCTLQSFNSVFKTP